MPESMPILQGATRNVPDTTFHKTLSLLYSFFLGIRNHFTQSYTSQVQWILEAVFARLGVRHEARNFGMGGLGTVHNAMGGTYVYGPDVDILMWDSGMTENDNPSQDLFHRQYILGGGKVPVLWSLALNTIVKLHLETGADVGFPGDGTFSLPVATSIAELDALPWAVRYMSCEASLKDICHQNEYNGTCWVERDDYTPTTPQKSAPGGRASWHPGNRRHQLRGRVLAFTILTALKEALTIWSTADGYALPDDAWHMTERYESVRAKVSASVGDCHEKMKNHQLEFVCKYPVKVKEYYPHLKFVVEAVHPRLTILTIFYAGENRVYTQSLSTTDHNTNPFTTRTTYRTGSSTSQCLRSPRCIQSLPSSPER